MSSIASSTVANGLSVRVSARHLTAASYPAEQPLDVLGEHVDLEVHLVARRRGAPSVVCASVCGTSATSKPVSSSAAIVSETPSTAIEPFSTQ